MTGGYRIDAQVLREVLSALDRGGNALAGADAALRDAPVTELGGVDLDAVAGELLSGWSAAVTTAGGAFADSTDGVRRCLADYADTESRIKELFDQDGSA